MEDVEQFIMSMLHEDLCLDFYLLPTRILY